MKYVVDRVTGTALHGHPAAKHIFVIVWNHVTECLNTHLGTLLDSFVDLHLTHCEKKKMHSKTHAILKASMSISSAGNVFQQPIKNEHCKFESAMFTERTRLREKRGKKNHRGG